MNASELSQRLEASDPPLLLHVLPEEVFSAQRIPGSRNACVYKTSFLDDVAEIVAGKQEPIIVYGAGEDSLDAKVAAEKLRDAGYAKVEVFEGGLPEWLAQNHPCEGSQKLPEAPVLHGSYRIDPSESLIRWTGRSPLSQHYGTVRIASGEIEICEGKLESARFVVDMDSIVCDDLKDSESNSMLIRHLKHADFFEVSRHPTAELVVECADSIEDCTEGTPNYFLRGHLTLRGVTQALEFPVVIGSADGKSLTGQAQFEVDRTRFGSIYGSGKLFRFLGQHVVNDHVHLHVKIRAQRSNE